MAAAGTLAAIGAAAPAGAQQWQVDASGTATEFDAASTLNSASVAPQLAWQSGGVYAALSGDLVGFEGAQWSTQGEGDFSLLANPFSRSGPLRMELVGLAGGTYHSSDFRTATTRAEARLHVVGRYVGGWLGAVGATGWSSSDTGIVTAVGPTAGGWVRYGSLRGTVIATPLRQEGWWFPEVSAHVSVALGPVDVLAYSGWRGAPAASGIGASTWGGVTAAWWVHTNAALLVAAGSYPPDLLQGLPRARYLSAGIRLAGRRPVVPVIKPLGRPVYEVRGGVPQLQFHLPDATRVDIVGDWTSWQPVAMQRGPGGNWTLPTHLSRGVYRFNLIVDGERWMVPKGVTVVDDGYGGHAGLLIVP